jgi:hypothetical protein
MPALFAYDLIAIIDTIVTNSGVIAKADILDLSYISYVFVYWLYAIVTQGYTNKLVFTS